MRVPGSRARRATAGIEYCLEHHGGGGGIERARAAVASAGGCACCLGGGEALVPFCDGDGEGGPQGGDEGAGCSCLGGVEPGQRNGDADDHFVDVFGGNQRYDLSNDATVGGREDRGPGVSIEAEVVAQGDAGAALARVKAE